MNCMRSIFVLLMVLSFETIKAQSFTNIAHDQGIVASASGNYGNGVSFYDWNKDGFDDVSLNSSVTGPRFFQNNNGFFTEVFFSGLNITGDCKAINWVDMNNDGFPDISFNTYLGKLRFFINDGNFQFTEISLTCGINQDLLWGYALSWADYNKDGFLDVYVSNYMDSTVTNARTNFLYKNNGDGTFEDVSVPSGTDNGYHYTLQSIWFDYDNDSWPDLFVNNDRSVHRNYLYHNNGNGTFTEVGIQAGIGVYIDAMSASVADFNNDGWFDIYITDTPGLGNYLFRNNGNGTFTNVAAINNVTSGQFTWGAVWIDADNNKLQDLFVASMPYLPNSFPGYNSYFKNYGNIFDPQYSTGLTIDAGSTFSCARGDINNDGFPDLLTHSYAPLGTQIWQNNGGSGHFFKVGLQGVFSNEDAIGTRIELYAGGVKQFRYTFCGEQYISQNSQWQHFGLGTTTSIDSLIIRWPRGHIDAFYHLPVDETRLFVEGETLNASLVLQGATSLCEGESAQLNAGSWVSYAWSSGDTTSSITVSETGDYSAMVFNGSFYIPSDTIHIEVHPTPSVSITAQSPNCFALSNGFIQISSDTSGTVVWTDGVEGFIRNVISAGTYSFTYVSPEACEVSDELILTQPEQLHVVTEFSAELCPGTWSASVIPSGGTPPYSYNWDFYQTNETSPFLSISDSVFTCHTSSSNQTVVYTVVDANGCTVTGEQDLGYILAYAEIAATELTVFPNPVDAEVNVNAALSIDQLSVYDASGRLLLTKHHSSTCDISMLARGFYVVQLKTGGQTYYRSIMKK